MVKVGDILFCLTSSDKERSYWVCKQVAAIDPAGQVTHVQTVDEPESVSPIHIFLEYKVPKQNSFLPIFAKYLQKAHDERVEVAAPDHNIDEIVLVLFTPLNIPLQYIQTGTSIYRNRSHS